MAKSHLLVVDDDLRIRNLLSQFLQKHDFLVTTACDAKQAREALISLSFDLIILDIMMPGETGTEFAQDLRSTSDIAILMLTALSETSDRIAGLESGADDYLPKPFDPKELVLRIKNLLNRSKINKEIMDSNLISINNILFDPKKNILIKDDITLPLSSIESKLLKLLLDSKGDILTRAHIAQSMGNINPRSVDVQITRLRLKLERDPKNPLTLRSIRNQGYVLYA